MKKVQIMICIEFFYLTLIICRKACKKTYFEMLCFKFAVGNVHKDYIPNQKLLKKPNYVSFVKIYLWKPCYIKEATADILFLQQNSTCWKKIKWLVSKQL